MSSISSFIPILLFVVPTIVFYYFKPKPTLENVNNANPMFTLVYFVFVVMIQFACNIGLVINQCGGSVSQNIAAAVLITFLPWIVIFGLVVSILMLFPGIKSAFSNVVGYFVVAGKANRILNELLINTDIAKAIDQDASAKSNVKRREELQSAAESIIKLFGNVSVLINQIVPSNFQEYWSMLHPLMKPQYQNDTAPETLDYKQQLLDVVATRDNIGEALWYIYTAVLLISITQYNIASRTCTQDLRTMTASQSAFQQTQKSVTDANAKATSTTYAIQ